jgi:hypothetical protein
LLIAVEVTVCRRRRWPTTRLYTVIGSGADRTQCIFTWIVVIYGLVSEKAKSANGAYNIWAILALDLFMAIFWLASLGANAALRATFVNPVNIEACFDDGSLTSSTTCITSKRSLEKRAVATPLGLALMSAIAGVSALEW